MTDPSAVSPGDTVTTLARAWALTRRDGQVLGFTDHDCDLAFDGLTFKADTGLTARRLEQSTGLSIDNGAAFGALSSSAIREADIIAGRYDGAGVRCWLVNWQDTGQRQLLFRGHLGQITRTGHAFEAELRGLSAALNRPLGRVYQKTCTAVLGDRACGFDLERPGYAVDLVMPVQTGPGTESDTGPDVVGDLIWPAIPGFAEGWFAGGRIEVNTGRASGLWAAVRSDVTGPAGRQIALWEPLRLTPAPGDQLRLIAGCDKRMETCRLKFANILNFQGFPDIPGEDWSISVPRSGSAGGSRR